MTFEQFENMAKINYNLMSSSEDRYKFFMTMTLDAAEQLGFTRDEIMTDLDTAIQGMEKGLEQMRKEANNENN